MVYKIKTRQYSLYQNFMRKQLVFLTAILILTGGGCTTKPPATPTNQAAAPLSEAELKNQLETTYNQVQTALNNSDYDAFISLFSKTDARATKKMFLDSLVMIKKEFKPLSERQFITVYQKGDKAYYIYRGYLSDPLFITIEGQIYNLKDGQWKVGEYSYSTSINKDKENPTNDTAATQKGIDEVKKELENYQPEKNQ